jgi:protein-S-isoprenylcysteine O-methyltransferase Ste14
LIELIEEDFMDFFDWFSLVSQGAFLCAFLGRTIILSAQKVRVFVIGSGKKGIDLLREVGAVIVLLLFWVLIVAQALHAPWAQAGIARTIFLALPARISGAALVACGIALFVAALASFGASWRIGIDTRKPGALVTGGAFGVSRNPVFFGMDLIFAGTFLIYPTWMLLALAAVFIVGVHFHILEEERFLTEKYGDAYKNYRARAPRYIII